VNVFLSGPGPLVTPRSAYLAQLARIAPPELMGREAELAELAGFCLDEARGPYVWWQAGPWAGKSALLSTFVLNPPPTVQQRVQVVAFFITARLAGSDTRAAFVAAITEQLGALTGQQPPTTPDEGLREAWLLDLLAQAATACAARGVRLVLLVDGLDEDRSTTEGRHAHSIAGLLPAVPQAGMRVIVAGRPNPPVPEDVPDWHPLRDPGIVRRLSASRHARDLQRLGQTELKRLVKGTEVERSLLGLLAAARGGLSGPDLRELTGAGLADIEDVLHTVAGRTFTRRAAEWDPDTGPEVYLLGHEQLQQAATSYVGEPLLTGYRTRLHAWAGTYRTPADGRPRWPAGTPEYLLRGYPRMLATTGEVTRLVDLVTDPDRHDRMLDLTGGDVAALTEITTCQDLVLAQPVADLEAMLRLCIRRTNLTDRNTNIPTGLPAVWATLGQLPRAEALALSITDPYQQAQALGAVAEAVAATGDADRARQVADRAEAVARSITDPDWQAQALVAVAGAVAAAGDADRARQVAEQAEALARSITSLYEQTQALGAVAKAVAATGDTDRARQVADRAEAVARSITDPDWQAQALVAVTWAVAAAGDADRARQVTDRAEALARSITDPYWQEETLVAVAWAVAAAGDTDRAEALARSITDPYRQEQALVAVAWGLAAAGDTDRAEALARSITIPNMQV
jgi:tetratricopeptide (TPR) repeat protein